MNFYVPSPIVLVYAYPGVVDGGFELLAISFSLATFAQTFFATISRVIYPGRKPVPPERTPQVLGTKLLASRGS